MSVDERPLIRAMCSDVLAAVQDEIASCLEELYPCSETPIRLLDVGCWDGSATIRFAQGIGAIAHGIDIFEAPAAQAAAHGVHVVVQDLETVRFPWSDATFDVVIANQVFEHLKNIWLPLSEVYRVLRPGGHFLISVPNLASLHNRLLLLLGVQPTSIRAVGPHVRGFTLRELTDLVTREDAMRCLQARGIGFYPLPVPWARPFARTWTGGSHTILLLLQKQGDRPGSPWDAFMESTGVGDSQTYYA